MCMVGLCVISFAAVMVYRTAALPLYCYGLSSTETAAFLAAAEEWSRENGRRIKLVIRNADDIVHASPSKPAIFQLGAASKLAAANYATLSNELYKSLPRSIRETVQRPDAEQGDYYALPLLIDHLEFFKKDNKIPPDSRTGLHDIAMAQEIFASSNTRFAFAFNGSSDTLLLDIIGQMLISAYGKNAYRELCNLSLKNTSAKDISTRMPAFSETLTLLNNWRASGWLHPNWKDFTEQTAEELFRADILSYTAQYLSAHRRVARDVLYQGQSLPFLELRGGTARPIMTAPITAMGLPSTGRWQQETKSLAAFLVRVTTQELLSQRSMLAPVNLSSKAADVQARAVRDNAAIATILQGFSLDGFLNAKQRRAFAAEVRSLLR
jgi:hypothetical protein